MKKLLLAAFVGALTLTACSKKTDSTESNTMLPEPDSTAMMSDTTKMSQAMDSSAAAMPMKTAEPMKADSTKMAK